VGLHGDLVEGGEVEGGASSGTKVFTEDTPWEWDAEPDSSFILKFTSGADAVVGRTFLIQDIGDGYIDIGQVVNLEGEDSKFQIRRARTLNEYFGTGVSGQLGENQTVSLTDEDGVERTYFHDVANAEFRDLAIPGVSPSKPIPILPANVLTVTSQNHVTRREFVEVGQIDLFPTMLDFSDARGVTLSPGTRLSEVVIDGQALSGFLNQAVNPLSYADVQGGSQIAFYSPGGYLEESRVGFSEST